MAYIDTNVIVARYAHSDPLQPAAESFLQSEAPPRVISPLTVAELSAVLARQENRITLPPFLRREKPARRVRAIAEYFIRDCQLRIAPALGAAKMRIAHQIVPVPLEYRAAIQRAGAMHLRALDLLHITYAALITEFYMPLESFVTGDEEILTRADFVRSALGLEVRHPARLPSGG